MTSLRWILLPFTLIYGAILWIRNKLYDYQIFKSQQFNIPTIVVGNLVVGGAGKSPMTEYLISLLKDKYNLATLSRGYGRKTKGFLFVKTDSTSTEVGDEPLQFKRKFSDITVAVSEDRCIGITKLAHDHDVIILDDAFQHRRLKPKLSVLLFDFESLFKPTIPLPTGNFRDLMSQTKRADIVVITKCPAQISIEQKLILEKKISKHSKSPIFYSQINYLPIVSPNNDPRVTSLIDYTVVLFTGIANPDPLINHLKVVSKTLLHIRFGDHHSFTSFDFERIKNQYYQIKDSNKIIITTEKDFQRISPEIFKDFPFYIQPIAQQINQSKDFEQIILSNI